MGRAARLTFLCRGATASSRLAAFMSDEPLEPGQAAKLQEAVSRVGGAKRVLTSPEASALETARAFTERPDVAEALRDVDYGRWRALRLADVAASEPDALAALFSDPDAAPHGGESLARAAGRIAGWMETARRVAGHSLVVTHPAIIRLAVLTALDAPLQSFLRVDVGFLSITRFSSDGSRWALRL